MSDDISSVYERGTVSKALGSLFSRLMPQFLRLLLIRPALHDLQTNALLQLAYCIWLDDDRRALQVLQSQDLLVKAVALLNHGLLERNDGVDEKKVCFSSCCVYLCCW